MKELANIGSLAELLEYRGKTSEKETCLVLCPKGKNPIRISYGDLLEKSRTYGVALQRLGIKKGDKLLLVLPTCEEFFYSFWGSILTGSIPVPLYPPVRFHKIREYIDQVLKIAENSDARALITSEHLAPFLRLALWRAGRVEHILVAERMGKGKDLFLDRPAMASEDTALLQYTSGTTARPKGVELSHRNILGHIRVVGTHLDLNPDDVAVTWLPLYHDMGLIGNVITTLYWQVPLVVLSPIEFLQQPARWLWAMHQFRGTLSAAPNFAYNLCARKIKDHELEGIDLSHWRVALCGAELILPETIENFVRRFKGFGFREEAFFPAYGLAENTLAATLSDLNKPPHIEWIDRSVFEETGKALPTERRDTDAIAWVAVGRTIKGLELQIVDADGKQVDERVEGEIILRGPSVMKGYYNNPDATAEALRNEWLYTGDLGFVADGRLFVTGRKKEVIIRGGKNYYPQDLEAIAAKVEGVRQGCVCALGVTSLESGTEEIILLAEIRSESKIEKVRIATEIRKRIVDAIGCKPEKIILVVPGTIPKTSSGKVQRLLCKQRYIEGTLTKNREGFLWGLVRLTVKLFLRAKKI